MHVNFRGRRYFVHLPAHSHLAAFFWTRLQSNSSQSRCAPTHVIEIQRVFRSKGDLPAIQRVKHMFAVDRQRRRGARTPVISLPARLQTRRAAPNGDKELRGKEN